MKAKDYVLLLVLIFFRGIVIEAVKKIRPKGDVTKDQIQSPTAMYHLNEFEIEAARSKNALSKRAYRMQIISVLIVQYPCRHFSILRREYVTG